MSAKQIWLRMPDKHELLDDEVHVWKALLITDPQALARFRSHLNSEEIDRAERFVFPGDRDSYIAARGILRELLGAYTQSSAAEVDFVYGPQGKPALRASASPPVRFNLSHSHGWAVYAFSRHRELGIDVELIQPGFAGEEIAERYFSQHELAELRAVPQDQRDKSFFLCWTRKEAYVKARERGLQIPLASFDVSLSLEMPKLLRTEDCFCGELHSFEPAPQYVGALVTEGMGAQVRYWEWIR
jgi:4'-phosphopantetheinyl transferase